MYITCSSEGYPSSRKCGPYRLCRVNRKTGAWQALLTLTVTYSVQLVAVPLSLTLILTIAGHTRNIPVCSGISLIGTLMGEKRVCLLMRCPDFSSCNVHKQGVLGQLMCPVY